MLGVLPTSDRTGTAYVPPISAAFAPSAWTAGAAGAAVRPVAGGVDELRLPNAERPVQTRLYARYSDLTVATDDDGTGTSAGSTRLATPRRLTALEAESTHGRAGSARPDDAGRQRERHGATEDATGDVAEDGLRESDGSERGPAAEVRLSLRSDADVTLPVIVRESAEDRANVVVGEAARVVPDASVGPNCYVRADSFISEGVNVGGAVEVENSVPLSGARVPHLSSVGGSVVAPDTNVVAGSPVADTRHEDRPVKPTHDRACVATGRRNSDGEDARPEIGTRIGARADRAAGSSTDTTDTVHTIHTTHARTRSGGGSATCRVPAHGSPTQLSLPPIQCQKAHKPHRTT